MSWAKRRELIKLILIVIWLVFTVAFAIWWFLFSVDHISQLAALEPERIEHWNRQKRMVFWEGTSWLVLLILGGAALVGLVQREKLRSKRMREFFASFSHEVKTSLASLRVQAEALQDDLGPTRSPILDRLVADTVRLQVQLENSLFLASQDDLKLYLEFVRISALVERIREQWPNLEVSLQGDALVHGGERGLRTVFSNLAQNAHVHGKATRITVTCESVGERADISVRDNGRGFTGEVTRLGELFHRPLKTSGSGVGLHISQMLLRKMDGDLRFEPGGPGFGVRLSLRGESK